MKVVMKLMKGYANCVRRIKKIRNWQNGIHLQQLSVIKDLKKIEMKKPSIVHSTGDNHT